VETPTERPPSMHKRPPLGPEPRRRLQRDRAQSKDGSTSNCEGAKAIGKSPRHPRTLGWKLLALPLLRHAGHRSTEVRVYPAVQAGRFARKPRWPLPRVSSCRV